MKILVEHGDYDENEIILKCKELDGEMLEILSLLKDRTASISAYKDGDVHIIKPADVCYAEAVDGKTFIYTSDMVLETHKSLAALQDYYGNLGFVRIGKSQLVNLYHVAKLTSLPNSRIEISLKNNEKLIVSRHFIQSLKEKLGMLE